MRILMVTPRFRPDVGGVERHVDEVSRRLAANGCKVTVLTTGAERSLPRVEHADRVVIRRVRAWPRGRDYYFSPEIFAEVRGAASDVVHVQSYHTLVGPMAMLGAATARVPYVLTFHGGGHSSRARNRLRRAQLLMLRPLFMRAEKLIAVARFEMESYGRNLRIPPERFVLIPNGADLMVHAVMSERSSSGTSRSAMSIVSVGRLEKYKGHHRVLAALPHILQRRPDAELLIAGSGPYESQLRMLARKLGVADRVTIEAVPASEPQELAARITAAAVVTLLSEFETHPLAVLEAAALGRPVVVADTSGLRELAEAGLAHAIPLDSTPSTVAAAVLEVADRRPLSQPPDVPTWDDCAARLLELYRSVARTSARLH